MMAVPGVVIIIPAYNPDEKFVRFLQDLKGAGYGKIIIVDDGSRENTKHYFQEAVNVYGCALVVHGINLGQGRAYKSAFNYYLNHVGEYYANEIGVIQCDCDGQHHIEDIKRCEELMRENPGKFILGVRDFSSKSVPFRSKFGNNYTSWVFRFFCGLDLKDTQSGLKGIPACFIPALMEAPGERFEYASSTLLETKKHRIEIIQFPIRTIYINNNETSHFNPLLDSIRIYSLILKYLISSLSAFIIDVVLYSFFITLLRSVFPGYYIITSTYLAKVFSCTYGYVINKKLVFQSNGDSVVTAIKFFLLCIIQSTCSGVLTHSFVYLTYWNEVLCKVVVDTVLFFLSFQIQNRLIFKQNGRGACK